MPQRPDLVSGTNPTTTSSEQAKILHQRARKLAQDPAAAGVAGATFEALEFRLGSERYALQTRHIREVHPLRSLTPLPCTPAFVRGIVNVRGRILAVLDLKKLFRLPDEGLTDLHRVIEIACDGFEFGLLADAGVGVRTIPLESIRSVGPAFEGAGVAHLKGITADNVMVLDLEMLLADAGLLVDEQP